jgi:hypothetical protein
LRFRNEVFSLLARRRKFNHRNMYRIDRPLMPVVHTRDAMGALIARDAEKWVKLIKLAGIGPE